MGIGMMVNELKVCIEGISKRLIQGATMSVDASLALKYRPTAVLIGFLVSFLGGLLFMALTIALNHVAPQTFHVIVLPSLLVMFFLGGIVGVFADIKGGIIATVVASFIIGILVSLVPFFLSLT
jgi:PTS system ascorbate-specific IIC component